MSHRSLGPVTCWGPMSVPVADHRNTHVHNFTQGHRQSGKYTHTHMHALSLRDFPVSCGWHVLYQQPFLPISSLFNKVGANHSVYILWWEAKANWICWGNGIEAPGTGSKAGQRGNERREEETRKEGKEERSYKRRHEERAKYGTGSTLNLSVW